MAAVDTIAYHGGAPIASVCSCACASILLASEPDDQLTTGQKHRRASIPRSEPDKGPRVFLRRHERGDPRSPGQSRWAACRCPHLVIFIQREGREREGSWGKAKRCECA